MASAEPGISTSVSVSVSASADDSERPLRRDAQLNRRRILHAAREVFAARGLEATLNDIAHHAQLGVGTVYRRFPNKEALVEALFVERLHEVQAKSEDALAAPDCWGGLRGFMEWITGALAQDRGLYEVSLSGSYGHRLVAQARDEMCGSVARLIERAEQEGELRRGASGTDVLAFMVMLGALIEYSRTVRPELWRRYLGIFLDGLRNSPNAHEPLPLPPLNNLELERVVYARPGGKERDESGSD